MAAAGRLISSAPCAERERTPPLFLCRRRVRVVTTSARACARALVRVTRYILYLSLARLVLIFRALRQRLELGLRAERAFDVSRTRAGWI